MQRSIASAKRCALRLRYTRRNAEPKPETPRELGEISEAGSERNIENAARGCQEIFGRKG